ncbi:MAG: hypothetical protein AB1445_03520 [Bacillota bacterium]
MENCIFHDLKTHWHLTHCYHHEQPALYNLYLLYCLAFNLFMLFFHRQLRSPERERYNYTALARQLGEELMLLDVAIWRLPRGPD